MFTGLVEELGRVRGCERRGDGVALEISARQVLEGARVGDSIAVNGCCLTVTALRGDTWSTHAQPETLERTTLGSLAPGDPVNLERPLRLGDRVGGHLVQGHVDAVGLIVSRDPAADGSERVTIEAASETLRYVVEKGSITVDGVSLTVTSIETPLGEGADRDRGRFAVALIPHTLAVTTLGERRPGESVNLEVDILAKYVERLLPGAEHLSQSLAGAPVGGRSR